MSEIDTNKVDNAVEWLKKGVNQFADQMNEQWLLYCVYIYVRDPNERNENFPDWVKRGELVRKFTYYDKYTMLQELNDLDF
jgi:hypothetical protein